MKSRRLLIGLFVVQCSLSASAADWPQWRGPNRDGISTEKGLLEKWPADGPKLLWQKTDVGEGYATPAV
ncbi:MAG TPA: serine/threonine protein kinase, partial [Pirellulales bacterium]|nr:serine/threonine protein kinase [Pirellulales bacterium]